MNSATGSQSYNCGVAAYKQGNFAFAVDCFRVSLQRNPRDWQALFFLSMSLAQGDQLKIAESHFRTIAEMCPDSTLRERALLAANSIRAIKH